MVDCDICEKSFARRDNLIRHMKTVHDKEESGEKEESGDEEESGDDSKDSDISESEASETEDSDSYDPWGSLLEVAYDKLNSKYEDEVERLKEEKSLSDDDARSSAFKEMKSAYRKELTAELLEQLSWYKAIKSDHVYQAIKATAQRLRDEEDYEDDESWKYAVHKRKYLLDKILDEAGPPELIEEMDE